jgi:hypothetical protein
MTSIPATPRLREDGVLVMGGEPPPAPTYVRVTRDMARIVGEPVAWLNAPAAAYEYGWRVWAGPREAADDSGEWYVTLCADADWWASRWSSTSASGPVLRLIPVTCVWLVTYGVAPA